jgi:hypothetical protein
MLECGSEVVELRVAGICRRHVFCVTLAVSAQIRKWLRVERDAIAQATSKPTGHLSTSSRQEINKSSIRPCHHERSDCPVARAGSCSLQAQRLHLFNRAIGRSPSLQLHDNRAACHERLEDLPAALKDAKKSIQLGKEDPTGYVRAGRILVKMERKSVALEIYAHGLKSVKHAGQGYEVSDLIFEQAL